MRTNLTPTLIRAAINAAAATRTGRTLNDPGEPGLNLRVGARIVTWTWLGHDTHGRVRRFGLGRYPHVGLAEARRRARAMADEVRRGADPVAEARARRAAASAPKGSTLAQLLDLYGRQVGNSVKSWPAREQHIRRVFRAHLETPLVSLRVGALQMTVDGHPKPISASFGARYLTTVLRWAAAPGRAYVDRSLLDLRPSAPRTSRDRVLAREELRALLSVLRASGNVYTDALRFILLTAARRSEVAAARWRDVDFVAGTWTLPVTKNGKPHVVPLSRQAMELLRARMPSEPDAAALVFANSKGTSILFGWQRETERAQAASGTSGWNRHDLRRTAATLMGELGTPPAIIEAALNHVQIHSQIASVYNKSRYRPEVAAALQRLADVLDGTEAGGAEVLSMRG